jgi:hypothetical protein
MCRLPWNHQHYFKSLAKLKNFPILLSTCKSLDKLDHFSTLWKHHHYFKSLAKLENFLVMLSILETKEKLEHFSFFASLNVSTALETPALLPKFSKT